MCRLVPLFLTVLTLLVILSAAVPAAHARTDEDEGLWFMLAGQGDASAIGEDFRKLRWWLDVQPRLSQNADGLEQTLIRPGLGYAIRDDVALWTGYAWIRTKRGSQHNQEHRIWQQLTWSPKLEWFNLASRTRLEQRFQESEDEDEVGWRFRQFIKATKPLPVLPKLFLSIYDELFVDLNNTDAGQRSGISQNRLFAGLGWKFDAEGHISSEVGYLNQFIHNASGADRMNHILSVNLFLNF